MKPILIVLSPLCTPALYPRTVLSTHCTLDPLHSRLSMYSRLPALSSLCTLISLCSRLSTLSRCTLALHSQFCTLYSRLSTIAALCLPHCTFALHFRTVPSTLCTLDSLYSRLSVLLSLPLALHSRLCRLSVPSSLCTLAFCSDRALCSRP